MELIPKQCDITGGFKIGHLRNRLVLMNFEMIKDFINMLSTQLHYIIAKDMHIKCAHSYDNNFKANEETSQATTWISFPDLLLTFLLKKVLFSLDSVVRKPLHFDSTTINKTCPS